MTEIKTWEAPWIRPTGPITQAALTALDRPLKAWATGEEFDADDFYEERKLDGDRLSAVERQVRAAGTRPEWQMEFVWQPNIESSASVHADYETGLREVSDRMMDPRCLDDYTSIAYSCAERAGWSDDDYDGCSAPELESPWYEDALSWAAAGVCVLQQSLPWPFVDCLPWGLIDNRPAHRVMYAYASLLEFKHPRIARKWFRAMLFMNPVDNLGVRYCLAPRSKTDIDDMDD